jgi:DNA-binding Lrp family transcriptional regulator
MIQDSDAKVLACLREHGPGTITVKQLAQMTGLPRITVRTSVDTLDFDGLICLLTNGPETTYMIRHLHADPGECGQPLGMTVQEVHPDGQR